MQEPTSLYLSECSMRLLLLKVLEGPFLLVTISMACWHTSRQPVVAAHVRVMLHSNLKLLALVALRGVVPL